MKSLISIVLLTALFVAGAACGQAQSPRFPCEEDARFAEFDFWIGEWEVHTSNDTFAGTNSIEAKYKHCVLVETWTSAGGGGGTSINYLDHASGEWVQIWNDATGNQINIRGGLTDEGMLLIGTIHYVANNVTAPFKGLWTPLDDGRVRQFFQQYDEEADTWNTWFEGFYSRKSAD